MSRRAMTGTPGRRRRRPGNPSGAGFARSIRRGDSRIAWDRRLVPGAGAHRKPRVLRVLRLAARALAERKRRAARVPHHLLVAARIAEPGRGAIHPGHVSSLVGAGATSGRPLTRPSSHPIGHPPTAPCCPLRCTPHQKSIPRPLDRGQAAPGGSTGDRSPRTLSRTGGAGARCTS